MMHVFDVIELILDYKHHLDFYNFIIIVCIICLNSLMHFKVIYFYWFIIFYLELMYNFIMMIFYCETFIEVINIVKLIDDIFVTI